MRDVAIIGVASGWGAQDRGCEDGPAALQDSGLIQCLQYAGRPSPVFELLEVSAATHSREDLDRVVDIDRRLAARVAACIKEHILPIVVGGDHACAVGTWSGARAGLAPDQALGLIWVDAHMDSHVPTTSPSGALHGMPLACLLGSGPDALIQLAGPAPKLQPQHVCLIGVRSFERGEQALLESLGVRIYFMDEVNARGFDVVWEEAVRYVTRHAVGYGVTIDLDAIDPRDAPGVGTPENDGIAGEDLIAAVRQLHDDPRLLAMEIAEYNPHEDRERLTLKLLRRLICAAVAGKERDE